MSPFVEECRREWKRLGVPDSMAEEMAAELEADLAEAQADGVSANEMLGESDPRRFAATWATERGLVNESSPKRSRRRRWIWVAVGLALAFVFMTVFGLVAAAGVSTSVHASPPHPQTVRSVALPTFVGLKACKAVRKAIRAGLDVRIPGHKHGYSCAARVYAENETAKGGHRSVTLWLRRARR